jgi:glycosyltransferase involved in cell wall biosynthesis
MRIVVVTDAWHPQVNGVVRTYEKVGALLSSMGHPVTFITPLQFRSVPCPTYPEIRLSVGARRKVARLIEAAQPACIHIATEGPLGLAARAYCRRRGLPFTTSFHTKFPEYVHARCRLPLSWGYALVRWFHAPSRAVMVATEGIEAELKSWGVGRIRRWTRGVDTDLFRPRDKALFDHLPRPVSLYVGRVAVEKNIEAFLSLDLPGSKVVVGEGPQRALLEKRFPRAVFVGAKEGEDLARHYAAADLFVFPSRTDTFGLVLLEALASGLPVAAYPVPGPKDVLGDAPVGAMDEDLSRAARAALAIPPERCREFALARSWMASAEQFLANLSPFDPDTAFPCTGGNV